MSGEKVDIKVNGEVHPAIKVYKRRWIVLTIFILYSGINALQWIEYSIISDKIMKYYNVSSLAVDWTSIMCMALYAPLALPASYVVDRMGLRVAGLTGGLGTAIGTVIKVFSIRPDLFWIALLGQTIVAGSQAVVLNLPPRLAAVWFGPNEVSTACSLGILGTQLGIAIGFILPPLIVTSHDNIDDIGDDLYLLTCILAGAMVIVATAIIIYFPAHPPLPPSRTQLLERNKGTKFSNSEFFSDVKKLAKNKGFLMHSATFGINFASFSAISTLLNQFVIFYFPNSQKDAGMMGLTMVICGVAGSATCGFILDKTHKYKETTIAVCIVTCVFTLVFMYALEFKSKILAYVAIAILGWFTSSYWSVGYEMATELTYPLGESTTSGMLMFISQTMGVLSTLLVGWLFAISGPYWAIASQVLLLAIGSLITCFIPNELRRQAAFKGEDKGTMFKLVATEKEASLVLKI